MKIRCRTNLDLCPCEQWPTELPEVPRVGDYVESGHEWVWPDRGIKTRLRLKVYAVRWVVVEDSWEGWPAKWEPEIELNVPPPYENMIQFYEWYGRICGRGKSAFI